MQELVPLTISRSILGAPTVLVTNSKEGFLLYRPVDEQIRITHEILTFFYHHFKIERPKAGVFSLKGKKYFCTQEIDGAEEFSYWLEYLWDTKRKFNQFLLPKSLFYTFLIDLYFPIFAESKKLILPGKKNQFAVHPIPGNAFDEPGFTPSSPAKLGMTKGGVKSFFRYMRRDLLEYLDEFEALCHDKFRTDLKYRISLYPDQRNLYWNEFQRCFDPSFKSFTRAEIENYILKL